MNQQKHDLRKAGKQYEFVIASRMENVAKMLDFVAERSSQFGLNPQKIFQLQLGLDEAITNVIEHAYEGLEDELTIRCHCQQDAVVVEIQDRGKPFDPTQAPPPDISSDLQERPIGGLGVHFMRKMMDEITYRYDPALGNILRMVKRL